MHYFFPWRKMYNTDPSAMMFVMNSIYPPTMTTDVCYTWATWQTAMHTCYKMLLKKVLINMSNFNTTNKIFFQGYVNWWQFWWLIQWCQWANFYHYRRQSLYLFSYKMSTCPIKVKVRCNHCQSIQNIFWQSLIVCIAQIFYFIFIIVN